MVHLPSGDNVSVTVDTLFEVHGVLMWTGMGLLIPCGIFAAKFKRLFRDRWFNYHQLMQKSASMLIIAGFVMAVTYTSLDGMPHFSIPHKQIGLLLFILIFMQRINGAIRPSKSKKENEIKSKKRSVWEMIHKWMGYIIWLIGQYVLFTGLKLLNETLSWIQIGWSILQIIVFTASYCYMVKGDTEDETNITTKLNGKESVRYT